MEAIPGMKVPRRYFRVKPEYLGRFHERPTGDEERRWPTGDRFRRFFRQKQRGYRGPVERSWGPLSRGEPVPEVIAEAFVEYLDVCGVIPGAKMDSIFQEVPFSEIGIFRNPESILTALTGHLKDCDEMYLHKRVRDSRRVARMLLYTVGFQAAKPNESQDQESCVRRGEIVMGRSRAEYAGQLLDWSEGDDFLRTVMFIVSGGERIGAAVVLPLKEDTFRRICSGELHDKHLTREDLDVQSRYLFIHNMSNAEQVGRIGATQRTTAQARTICYQLAYYTRHLRPLRPVAISLAVSP
jgi:hypothetical protein